MRDADYLQPDFAYGGPPSTAPLGGSGAQLAIYANRAHLRASLREDADAAGMRISAAAPLTDLVTLGEGLAQVRLADVVLVDCPQVDAGVLAALARLDLRAATDATRLIVSTSVDALDDVSACTDQSAPVLLVDPTRAERVLALGRVLATMPSGTVRELSEDERLMLLRLTEQVGQIAGRMDRLDPRGTVPQSTPPAPPHAASTRTLEPGQLPDARLVRRIIRQRQLRSRVSMPTCSPIRRGTCFWTSRPRAWKESGYPSPRFASRRACRPPPRCAGSGRWSRRARSSVRLNYGTDKRRAFIDLSKKAVEAVSRYFAEIALTGPAPI